MSRDFPQPEEAILVEIGALVATLPGEERRCSITLSGPAAYALTVCLGGRSWSYYGEGRIHIGGEARVGTVRVTAQFSRPALADEVDAAFHAEDDEAEEMAEAVAS